MDWEILSRSAKRAISIARKEAAASNCQYILPEHLMIGLLKAGDNIELFLSSLGISVTDFKTFLNQTLEEKCLLEDISNPQNLESKIVIANETKEVLEMAAKKSKEEFLGQINSKLLLQEIYLQSNNTVSSLLQELGLTKSILENKIQTESILQTFHKTKIYNISKDEENINDKVDMYPVSDLTVQAELGNLDVVIGRDKEIEQILQILSRKKKNNPMILGDPGVGKTSLVESLAQKIVSQKVPGIYRNQRILSLDLCSMISGTKFRGDIEQKLQKLFSYIEEEGNIILFIDEIQQLFGKTGTEAPYLINLFKPYLNNCRTRILCTCDLQEYRKKVEKDSTFLRRFQPVIIGEPSPEETYHILEGVRPSFEKHHLVHISNNAIDSAVKLSTKYILGRYQPDQAIDLLDETCAHYCYTHQVPPDDLLETRNQIEFLEKRISHKQKNASDAKKEKQLLLIAQNEYLTKMNEWRTEANKYIVSSDDVAKVVSQWTNIPMGQLLESEKHKLMNIETELKQNIIGQNPALKSLANALRRSRLGIKDSNKPTGIFLFLGPTGVGKTETARVLAEYLFGTRTNLIRFDMSEYMEKHAVSRLIGAPPGYIGYEEGGQLTEAIKRKPYSILLFDEIEKAHSDIFNIWLQLFDDGRLTDAKGFTVDCSNCIVVLTSNIVHNTKDGILTVGFTDNKNENNDHESNLCLGESFSTEVNSKLKKYFRPELLNRLDEIVVFNSLSHTDLLKIINIMIKNICSDITNYNIELVVTDKAKNQLVEEGYHQDFGARPLRRVLQKRIVDELSLAFVENKIRPGDTYKIDFDGNQFEYNTHPKEESKQS